MSWPRCSLAAGLSDGRGEHRVAADAQWGIVLGPGGAGVSRLGGAPVLAAGTPWPHADDRPLTHLATIALDELPAVDGREHLPDDGLLSFFAELAAKPSWSRSSPDDETRARARRRHPHARRRARRTSRHRRAMRSIEQRVAAGRPPATAASSRYGRRRARQHVVERLAEAVNGPTSRQLLGHPWPVQEDPREPGQIVLFHIADDAGAAASPSSTPATSTSSARRKTSRPADGTGSRWSRTAADRRRAGLLACSLARRRPSGRLGWPIRHVSRAPHHRPRGDALRPVAVRPGRVERPAAAAQDRAEAAGDRGEEEARARPDQHDRGLFAPHRRAGGRHRDACGRGRPRSRRTSAASARSWPRSSATCAQERARIIQAARAPGRGARRARRAAGAPLQGRRARPRDRDPRVGGVRRPASAHGVHAARLAAGRADHRPRARARRPRPRRPRSSSTGPRRVSARSPRSSHAAARRSPRSRAAWSTAAQQYQAVRSDKRQALVATRADRKELEGHLVALEREEARVQRAAGRRRAGGGADPPRARDR